MAAPTIVPVATTPAAPARAPGAPRRRRRWVFHAVIAPLTLLWVARPRSLDFRFVLACAGVLGIGADITRWSGTERAAAAAWIARYKDVREVITRGGVRCSTPAGTQWSCWRGTPGTSAAPTFIVRQRRARQIVPNADFRRPGRTYARLVP